MESGGGVEGPTPYAGSTRPGAASAGRRRDHPRTRGEHGARFATLRPHPGPPPHARGAHRRGLRAQHLDGTTPARAGTTATAVSPRSVALQPSPTSEQSPHAQGAPVGEGRAATGRGTTPVRAGSTPSRAAGTGARGGHPRTRGEHYTASTQPRTGAGPPLHARGALQPAQDLDRRDGTTPARARTTGPSRSPGSRGRGHPRTRGDHPTRRCPPGHHLGPPPHARGPRPRVRVALQRAGTTPARAGTTCGCAVLGARAGDHPRTRGDHAVSTATKVKYRGPPPHARGPRLRGSQSDRLRGTTPARAGTTEHS